MLLFHRVCIAYHIVECYERDIEVAMACLLMQTIVLLGVCVCAQRSTVDLPRLCECGV